MIIRININKWMIPALVGIIFFVSCKNDIEVVQRITNIETFPTLEASDVTILRSDSGIVVMRIETPIISKYSQASEPYTSFPKGLKGVFFDRNGAINTQITADEVVFYENEEKWVARYNVEVVDKDGRIVSTEYMVFDQKMGKIYSDQFTKLTDQDAVIYGSGFESDASLSNVVITRPRADFYANEQK